MGIGQGVVARTEEAKNGRETGEQKQAECEPHGDIENHHIAQDAPRRFVVFLSETDAHQRRAADSDHRAEAAVSAMRGLVSAKPAMANLPTLWPTENGIDDVVERRSHHGDDGGQGILEQKRADGALSEFSEVVVLCHRGLVVLRRTGQWVRFRACKCTKKCGRSCRRGGRFYRWTLACAANLRSGLKKLGSFRPKTDFFLCETRGLSSEKSPLFLRPSHRLTLRWPGAAASLGSGGENGGILRRAKAKKSPSSPRRGRGVRPKNDRERDDQRAL